MRRRSKKVLGVLLNHLLDYFSAWHGIAWLAGIGLDHASLWILSVMEDDFVQLFCFPPVGTFFYISLPFFEVEDLGW
jgi:hypothetical protein